MRFEIVKVLDKIQELYKLPKSSERFDKYLYMLQGEFKKENDLLLPITGFNPMGNKLACSKLEKLIALKAEEIAEEELLKINRALEINDNSVIQVGLNLVDDIEGSWSNYYTADYTSKFEIASLLKRKFCTPYFWTSETISEETIIQRVRAYIYRTVFWIKNGKPETLLDFLGQEIYVCKKSKEKSDELEGDKFSEIENLYNQHFNSIDYNLKFNFFYGDNASKSLGYPIFGVKEKEGFHYAKFISKRR